MVEEILTEVDGIPLDGPNDLAFGPDGSLYFTDSGNWDPDNRPHPGRIVRSRTDGAAEFIEHLDFTYPNGIVVEPDGSLVWTESYTNRVIRLEPSGRRNVLCEFDDGHTPDGLKRDAQGNFWIATVESGGVVQLASNGSFIRFLPVGSTILNCAFGASGKLYCCDMGPSGALVEEMRGTLVEVELGVKGGELFKGEISTEKSVGRLSPRSPTY